MYASVHTLECNLPPEVMRPSSGSVYRTYLFVLLFYVQILHPLLNIPQTISRGEIDSGAHVCSVKCTFIFVSLQNATNSLQKCFCCYMANVLAKFKFRHLENEGVSFHENICRRAKKKEPHSLNFAGVLFLFVIMMTSTRSSTRFPLSIVLFAQCNSEFA